MIATISLHTSWQRKITWGVVEPKDNDLLYYTIKDIPEETKELIEKISEGNVIKINAILSNYI